MTSISEVLVQAQLVTKRTHNELMNRLNREEGEYHKEHILPRHFELGAFVRYRYRPRNRNYEQYKLRRFGHRLPHVFRGQLMPIVLATATVTATRSRWRVYARGTSAHRISAAAREELERVTDSEKQQIGSRISRKYQYAVRHGLVQRRQRKRLKG